MYIRTYIHPCVYTCSMWVYFCRYIVVQYVSSSLPLLPGLPLYLALCSQPFMFVDLYVDMYCNPMDSAVVNVVGMQLYLHVHTVHGHLLCTVCNSCILV